MNPPATTPGVTAPNASATTPDGLIVLWSDKHGEVVQASGHNYMMAALQAKLARVQAVIQKWDDMDDETLMELNGAELVGDWLDDVRAALTGPAKGDK